MKRGDISRLLRKFRLIYFTDWLRYYIQKYQNRAENRDFKLKNPNVILPPDYLIYESFQMNYKKYYTDGVISAKLMKSLFEKHLELKNKKILDWGCGPSRIVRHFPELIGNNCEYFGTDYNKKTIDWCTKNIKGVQFNHNTLEAKLPYENDYFDVIYGISIFTHLSEKLHYDWYNELYRVLKPNGIMVLTTQGDNFKIKLTDNELENYNKDELIVRGQVKEGHRTYSAFHPKEFMKKLFNNATILEHIEKTNDNPNKPPQDFWIIRK
jgi:ubiquinone/menaquinone biosynthesis C-methylase UbiE